MRSELSALLRGDADDLRGWIEDPSPRNLSICLLVIVLGCGSYGLTVGLWRAPLMGLFVAIKMPALILLTLACNGLLNGILGLALGSGLSFRQSIMAQLLSFVIAALVLCAIAPVTFFMSLNAPGPDASNAASAHANFLVTHIALIAYAGVISNLHLAKVLLAVTPNHRVASATMAAWLAGNAFVGTQLSWIMRPFFGTPSIGIQFLRDEPFDGTFYEVAWAALQRSTGNHAPLAIAVLLLLLIPLFLPILKLFRKASLSSKEPTIR